jgi:hypothetical protein
VRKTLLSLATAVALSLGASAASASEYLFRFDDTVEGALRGMTYQDGNVIQDVVVGAEAYNGTYGLWAGTLVGNFDVAFNIFAPNGELSDTWRIFGSEGSRSFDMPFHSDVDGGTPLELLTNGVAIIETGGFQTVYDFTVSNGDHYTLQFASDAIPEPASWALMIGGFGMVGAMMRRRKLATLQTA